jgi:hypothetical protein
MVLPVIIKMVCLSFCGYNFSNVGNAIIFQMTHDYVILDESLVVYRSAKVRDLKVMGYPFVDRNICTIELERSMS